MPNDNASYLSNRTFEERRTAKLAPTLCAARARSELANRHALSARAARLTVAADSAAITQPAPREAEDPGNDTLSGARLAMGADVAKANWSNAVAIRSNTSRSGRPRKLRASNRQRMAYSSQVFRSISRLDRPRKAMVGAVGGANSHRPVTSAIQSGRVLKLRGPPSDRARSRLTEVKKTQCNLGGSNGQA